MSAAMTEPMLAAELWMSFVSMLQSYAAAANVDGCNVWVQAAGESVTISALANQIEMKFDAGASEGTWEMRAAESSAFSRSFTIQPEGTIRIDGAIKDFDHAAIDLINSVTQRGKETW